MVREEHRSLGEYVLGDQVASQGPGNGMFDKKTPFTLGKLSLKSQPRWPLLKRSYTNYSHPNRERRVGTRKSRSEEMRVKREGMNF